MMKIKNLYLIIIIGILLFLLFVYLFFKLDIASLFEGEIRKAPQFDTTVTITNSPPEIISVSDVYQSGNPQKGIINPQGGCGLTGSPPCPLANLWFVVRDPNGAGDIDDNSISFNFIPPAPQRAGASIPGNCNPINCNNCPPTDKNYSCSVEMKYYYDPSISAGSKDWIVSISIKDNAGLSDDCSNANGAQCNPFEYTSVKQVDTTQNPSDPAPEITWSDVDVGQTGINQISDAPLTLYNRGNLDIKTGGSSTLNIIGHNLLCQSNGCDTSNDFIPSERFSVSGNNGDTDGDSIDDQCQVGGGLATALGTDSSQINDIVGINLQYNSPGGDSDTLFFCIYQRLDDLGLNDPQGYSTKGGGVSWEIVV